LLVQRGELPCQLYVVFQSRDESQPMVTVLTGSESEWYIACPMSIVPGVVASTKCVSKLSQRGQLWVGRSISRRPPTRARYTWHPLAVFYSVVPEAGTRFLIPGSPTALIAPFATNPGKTFGIFYAGCRVRMIMLRDCDTLRHFVHLALEKVFESDSTQAWRDTKVSGQDGTNVSRRWATSHLCSRSYGTPGLGS
jgi:hypothetical protein